MFLFLNQLMKRFRSVILQWQNWYFQFFVLIQSSFLWRYSFNKMVHVMPVKILSPLGAFLFILYQQYNNAQKHPYVVFDITHHYSNMRSPSLLEKCSFMHCSPELFFGIHSSKAFIACLNSRPASASLTKESNPSMKWVIKFSLSCVKNCSLWTSYFIIPWKLWIRNQTIFFIETTVPYFTVFSMLPDLFCLLSIFKKFSCTFCAKFAWMSRYMIKATRNCGGFVLKA